MKQIETEDQLLNYEAGHNSGSNHNLNLGSKLMTSRKESITVSDDVAEFVKKIEEIRETEEGIEDEFTTAELFRKIYVEEVLSTIYTLSAIVSAIIHYEAHSYNQMKALSIFCLIMVSIFNILFCLSSALRNYLNFRRRVSMKELTNRDRFVDHSNFKWMVFEIIFAIVSPNYGFYIVKITTDITWNNLEITYEVNHILIVLQIFRVYSIFRFIIASTPYANERAYRVGKMMGLRINLLFSIRSIFYAHPVKLLLYTFIISMVCLAYMVKILEGPVYGVSATANRSLMNFNVFENCLWNILVTMTTVGYGDFYPSTNLGRLVLIMTAFSGAILISIMALITGSKLSLSETEQKIFDFSNRLDARYDKDETFTKYTLTKMKFKTKYYRLKKLCLSDPKFVNTSQYLKLKLEVEGLLYEKISRKKESRKSF